MVFDPHIFSAVLGDIALALAAMTLGIMLFFSAIVIPGAARVLDTRQAGDLTRALFPAYDLAAGLTSILAAAAAVPASRFATVLLFLAAVGFLWLRQALMPRLDDFGERSAEGDKAARERFHRFHRLSIRAHIVQLAMVVGAVVVLVGY